MYKLLIEDDEGGQTAVSLIRDEITIGRKEGNTIRLTDRNVSRRHGRIVREDDRIYIEDVEARYGIKKNGVQIDQRAQFSEGDVVLIGDYRLTLEPEAQSGDDEDEDSQEDSPAPPEKPDELASDQEQGFSPREETQVMPALAAKLVVISSNFAGEEFELNRDEMVVGRSEDCDIIIDHRSVSSRHAKLVREDSTNYKIIDLDSKNGVIVSGEEYSATLLKRGDIVELGHVKLRFVEPGENYEFDPESAHEAVAAPVATGATSGGLNSKMIAGIAAGIFAAVALGGLWAVASSDSDKTGEPQQQEEQQLADIDEKGDEGIDEVIEEARAEIERGVLSGPTTRLETLQNVADPSAEQAEQIDRLLSTARTEQPFKSHYDAAVDALEDDQPLVALREVSSIPSHSLFYDRLEDQQLVDEVLDEALAKGYETVEAGQFDRTREIADDILMADPNYTGATDLLEETDERERRAAAAQRHGEPVAAADDTAGSPPTGSTGGDSEARPERDATSDPEPTDAPGAELQSDPQPQPDPEPEPDAEPQPRMTAEEARQKYNAAAREITGDPRRAIDICSEALEAGYTDCHRILGLAYVRLDDSDSACRHFEQYMATDPSNPAAVQSQMDQHGCND